MTFGQAIQSGFRNYANFGGRASRSAFWYWILFVVLIHIAVSIVLGDDEVVWLLVSLALVLPNIAVWVRRLHDIDRTGWWFLLFFVPIAFIVPIYWACCRGTQGSNRFGSDPLAIPFDT